MDIVGDSLINLCACLSAGILSFRNSAFKGTLRVLTNEDIVKRIILYANYTYWKNKEVKANGRIPLGFQLMMLFVFMSGIIISLSIVIFILLGVIASMMTMLMISCEKQNIFQPKIERVVEKFQDAEKTES